MPGENPRQTEESVSGDHEDSRNCGARGKRAAGRAMRLWALASTTLGTVLPGSRAIGQELVLNRVASPIGTFEVIQLSVFSGVLGAALLSAFFLIRERGRTEVENKALRAKVGELNSTVVRTEALLNLRDQRLIVWSQDSAKPELVGALPTESGAPDERASFLAFGRWLTPRSASIVENAVAALREKGVPFDRVVESQTGAPLEVRGRKTPSHAIVRFVSLSETQRAEARLRLENQRLAEEYENFLGMANAIDMPLWVRGADGHLRWVNAAYAKSVEAGTPEAAVRDGRELLGTQAREAIAAQHKSHSTFAQTVSTVVSGDRRMFSVTDFATASGSAGMAFDVSSAEVMREDYARIVRNHADTLDQLTTAVAQFDSNQKLRFYNNAFQKLWELEIAFLDSAPDMALVLDRLRGGGKIAEQPDWRRWKDNLLSVYRSIEPAEHWWHLPDNRTIRVVANPHPKGGVTWVFENLTEKIDLESRYNAAIRVQSETLDSLTEGVAVFGSDGRTRLANPAFAQLWNLSPDSVTPNIHISALKTLCESRTPDRVWDAFVASVTGFDDERRDRQGQTELKNGTILRYTLINLPNGQVMITFIDVTDNVNVERALKEKNDALERADQLKNDFVQRVSYELRSPLTNIIGFTELLGTGATGPLNAKQTEYVDHIFTSSSVLLTLVNDILDLATVDAGIMQLEIGEVRVTQVIASASEIMSDRFSEHGIGLAVDVANAPEMFLGDENRIRQVISNLLSNAANYAPAGSIVSLTCRDTSLGVEFAVRDEGPGMSEDLIDFAFQRFETFQNGGRRRGAGLGLSIVKSFVELHGGTVRIQSREGEGTTVICFFPRVPKQLRDAAE